MALPWPRHLPPIADELSLTARDKLRRIGHAVADAILERPYEPEAEPAAYDATSRRRRPVDVLLAAESVADVQASAAARRATAPRTCVSPRSTSNCRRIERGDRGVA